MTTESGQLIYSQSDSLIVAKIFDKEYKHVLRGIAKIADPEFGLSEEFRQFDLGTLLLQIRIKQN